MNNRTHTQDLTEALKKDHEMQVGELKRLRSELAKAEAQMELSVCEIKDKYQATSSKQLNQKLDALKLDEERSRNTFLASLAQFESEVDNASK